MKLFFSTILLPALALGNTNFDSALSTIIERSTEVKVQRETSNATRARNTSTGYFFLPDVTANAKYEKNKNYASDSAVTRGVDLTATMNLWKWGADDEKLSAARAEEKAESHLLDQAILNAEQSGVNALIGVIEAQKKLIIFEHSVDSRKKALTIAKARYKKGLLSKEETDKILIDLGTAIAQQRDQETELIKAKADLNSLLGHTKIDTNWPWKAIFSGTKSWKFPAEQTKENHELKAAKQKFEQAKHKASQSWREIFPALDANASIGYTENTTTGTEGQTYGGGVTLTIPLFNRLEDYGNYRESTHNKIRSEALLEKARRDTQSKWQATKGAFEVSLKSALDRDKTMETAAKLYQVNLKRFRRGLVNANELSVDLTRLLDSERFATQGWASVHVNLARLCHVVGKRVSECLK